MSRVHGWSSSILGSLLLLMGAPGLAFDKSALNSSEVPAGDKAVTAASPATALAPAQQPTTLGDPVAPVPLAASEPTMLDLHRDALHNGAIGNLSDEDLTVLASFWGVLTPTERRHLLAEMRGRMARSQTRIQRLSVPKGRQYGKVIRKVRKMRQADGSVVVETHELRVTPQGATETHSVSVPLSREAAAGTRARVTFGIGFEQRARERAPVASEPGVMPEVLTPPVITVGQQPPAALP
ncbi:MAG: hypothetical protein AAF993_12125 [Pseudomonadota bacterium]